MYAVRLPASPGSKSKHHQSAVDRPRAAILRHGCRHRSHPRWPRVPNGHGSRMPSPHTASHPGFPGACPSRPAQSCRYHHVRVALAVFIACLACRLRPLLRTYIRWCGPVALTLDVSGGGSSPASRAIEGPLAPHPIPRTSRSTSRAVVIAVAMSRASLVRVWLGRPWPRIHRNEA